MPQPESSKPEPLPGQPPPPKASRINVEFIGGKAFKQEEMRTAIADTLGDIERQGLSNALADDAAFFLANYYREHGYSQVEVAWETPSPSRLRLRITEGPQNHLGRVSLEGNRQISSATLLDYLMGPTHERFPHVRGPSPFVEADIESGVGWVQAFYLSQGFLNASVSPAEYQKAGGGVVNVRVQVSEGIRYTFGEIRFSGEPLFPREQLLQQLEKARTKASAVAKSGTDQFLPPLAGGRGRGRGMRAGGPKRLGASAPMAYTTEEVNRFQQALEYFYKTEGYFEASVESSSDPSKAVNGKVAVEFAIHPGAQYRFDSITVTGLQKLKPSFLPKRFRSLEGQVYSPEKVQQKVEEMTATGLFKSFRVRQEGLPDHTVRLDIAAEEAKAKELGFLLGYSTLEGGVVGASYRDRNLFGEGRPLTANAQYSTRGLRGEVLYTDPWFLSDNLTLRTRLYALTRQYDGYSKLEEGLRGELARKFKLSDTFGGGNLELSGFLQARHVDLQDVLIQPAVNDQLAHVSGKERARRREQAREDLIGPTSYNIDSFGLSANLDTRDSKMNPTRGYFINTTIDSAYPALGSQIDFVRGTIAASYYKTVGKTGLLAFGARAGVINPFGSRSSIPIDERFFNGGSLSVRSFTERHLGPKDKNGFPIGGDSFTVYNIEYDHPIRGELSGAAFIDAGSLGQGNEFGKTRYGVGLGLRYRLPIGPLRIDYGFNPARHADESVGAWHFSFGFAF
jgi:outer membrane protein assembly factor BamA